VQKFFGKDGRKPAKKLDSIANATKRSIKRAFRRFGYLHIKQIKYAKTFALAK
jgi:phosphoribosylformylglycinamidine (FGAM) synthase PurS component